MNYLLIILIILYIFLVFSCVKRYARDHISNREIRINKLKNDLLNLEDKKEVQDKERRGLQAEATNVFTLFEITKDITNILHEEEAFKVFEKILAEHISFTECKFLKPDSKEIKALKMNEDYFIVDLKVQDKDVGYLVIKGINAEEKEKTTILTTQFSLALRRVELYQEIERIAITDSLTELHTRRYALERLHEEIQRSKAQKLKLAVLMIDVDHFKSVNDTYGHLTGDLVLREIAGIIKDSLREIDIAGRYGGEEFCIVLPDTGMDGAQFVAERIRCATEEAHIKAYDTVVRVSVSIGICQFPLDGQKSTELIDKADWALYRAKKRGRNRVCSFGIYDEQGEK